jgi:hypothetical protein
MVSSFVVFKITFSEEQNALETPEANDGHIQRFHLPIFKMEIQI